MPRSIDKKLVIAVASSALFDLGKADAIYRNDGIQAYRDYQLAHENDVLEQGVAFPFIRRFLTLNEVAGEPVEVVLLSQNDPGTGIRVLNSIERYGLKITRAAFRKGRAPGDYLKVFNAKLFLSANETDVVKAIDQGHPAGHVLPSVADDDEDDQELRIAFDFDGVLADDKSERIYQEEGLDAFKRHESKFATVPLDPGPLKPLLEGISEIQNAEIEMSKDDKDYEPRIRTAIFTARSVPSHKRVMESLRSWGVAVDEAFFLDGMEKARVLREFKPHVFFDDQTVHTDLSRVYVPSVHIPFVTKVCR